MSFWDNVTGGTIASPQRPQALTYPQPVIYQPPLPSLNPQAVDNPVDDDPTVAAAKRKAPSSRSTMTCPNCFGSNIAKPSPNVMEQCFECGWNPRFDQMAAGIQTSGGEGPTHPSRQVSTANNYNPQQVVGKVG